jgi:uncharacterized membrane protein YdfJ with MMPL/SSD domain
MGGVGEERKTTRQDAAYYLGDHEAGNEDQGNDQAATAGFPQVLGVVVIPVFVVAIVVMSMPFVPIVIIGVVVVAFVTLSALPMFVQVFSQILGSSHHTLSLEKVHKPSIG